MRLYKDGKHNCKHYCPDYENCTKKTCDRIPLFKYGKQIVMVDKEQGLYHDYKMRKMLYREMRVTKIN